MATTMLSSCTSSSWAWTKVAFHITIFIIKIIFAGGTSITQLSGTRITITIVPCINTCVWRCDCNLKYLWQNNYVIINNQSVLKRRIFYSTSSLEVYVTYQFLVSAITSCWTSYIFIIPTASTRQRNWTFITWFTCLCWIIFLKSTFTAVLSTVIGKRMGKRA